MAIVLLVPQLTGCYHYVPAQSTALPAGADVSVGVTDRGRVALEEAVGPGVRSVEGRLLQRTDTSVVLSVNSVRYYDLGIATWEGERIEIGTAYISELRQRRLSQTRSLLAGALIAGALVAASFLAITGFGGSDVPSGPGDGGVDQ